MVQVIVLKEAAENKTKFFGKLSGTDLETSNNNPEHSN